MKNESSTKGLNQLSLDFIDGSITVIVPVYNEERVIEESVQKLHETLSTVGKDYEIIVVDDGSTDESRNIIRTLKNIRYFYHEKNKGYGAALKSGLKRAKGEVIIIVDADGTYPMEMIPNLLEAMQDSDMVVGARSLSSRNIAPIRKPMKWILGKLANYLSDSKIPDLNSGLRAFRKDAAMTFLAMYPNGFSFTTTITLAMLCNDYDVKYIPIEYNRREGKSKISPLKDTYRFIKLIWRTVMYFNPKKIFIPITLFIFTLFIMTFIYDVAFLNNITEKSIILFSLLINLAVVGLLADLIEKRNPFRKV